MGQTFGEKLKLARTDKGLKQSELAKILGVTNTTISNWEKNVSKPDLDMLSYICGALNTKVNYFLSPILPDGEVSVLEYEIIKKYRKLDEHGKKMVDFTLSEEYTRSISELEIIPIIKEHDSYELNAAHSDDYINASEDLKEQEESIMDDKNF